MANSSRIFYLGVEGGATKSEAILSDSENKIFEKRAGHSLNYRSIGKLEAKRNLASLIRPFIKKIGRGELRAVFGLAGLYTDEDEVFYREVVKPLLPSKAIFRVINDAEVGLEATCPGEVDRVLVISGTGSTAYGESGKNFAKTIGWDFILGDEGSSYAAGLAAIKAAIRSWDGRGPKTVLESLALGYANSNTMEKFIPTVYKNSEEIGLKYYIASFSPIIDDAIRTGDKVAENIRDEAAIELALGVWTVAKKLKISRKKFCIGLIGSQWKMPGLLDMFKKEVMKNCPNANFSGKKGPGVWGALSLAKNL